MHDNGGDLYSGLDSVMEDAGDKFVHIFSFITKNMTLTEAMDTTIELSAGRKILNGFETFFYIIIGSITTVLGH